MADIFISYAKKDRERVEPLAKALEEQGWSVWWDRTIPVAQAWHKIIEEAVDNASSIIVVWSRASVDSDWVLAEAEEGLKRRILVPVLFENVRIPLLFRSLQAANLIEWEEDQSDTNFKQLKQALSAIIGSPEPIEQELTEEAETFKNIIDMEFVLIPAGSFMMGTELGGLLHEEERPQRQVTISKPFYLQTTQVTQGQWQEVMEDDPSFFEDCGDDCPVEGVSWDEAQKFINKLNEMEGTDKYRLPTEAEWEYACRAGTTTDFFFGDDASKLSEYGWHRDNSEGRTHPVGTKKPNLWGLYDMHGNVFEWCQDWYGDYPSGPVNDPTGPKTGKQRIYRGGCWHFRGDERCAAREKGYPTYHDSTIGFRCAKTF